VLGGKEERVWDRSRGERMIWREDRSRYEGGVGNRSDGVTRAEGCGRVGGGGGGGEVDLSGVTQMGVRGIGRDSRSDMQEDQEGEQRDISGGLAVPGDASGSI